MHPQYIRKHLLSYLPSWTRLTDEQVGARPPGSLVCSWEESCPHREPVRWGDHSGWVVPKQSPAGGGGHSQCLRRFCLSLWIFLLPVFGHQEINGFLPKPCQELSVRGPGAWADLHLCSFKLCMLGIRPYQQKYSFQETKLQKVMPEG